MADRHQLPSSTQGHPSLAHSHRPRRTKRIAKTTQDHSVAQSTHPSARPTTFHSVSAPQPRPTLLHPPHRQPPSPSHPRIHPASTLWTTVDYSASTPHPPSIPCRIPPHPPYIHPASTPHPMPHPPASTLHPTRIHPISTLHPPRIRPASTLPYIHPAFARPTYQ